MDSFQAIDRHDSRHAMKQRDIKQLVSRMGAVQEKKQAEWESSFGDELVAATEEAVLRGGGDRSILHGSTAFRKNFDKWMRSLK